jgi:hypothetical protein
VNISKKERKAMAGNRERLSGKRSKERKINDEFEDKGLIKNTKEVIGN